MATKAKDKVTIELTPLAKLIVERKGDGWLAEVFVWGFSIQWSENEQRDQAITDCLSCVKHMAESCEKAADRIAELMELKLI